MRNYTVIKPIPANRAKRGFWLHTGFRHGFALPKSICMQCGACWRHSGDVSCLGGWIAKGRVPAGLADAETDTFIACAARIMRSHGVWPWWARLARRCTAGFITSGRRPVASLARVPRSACLKTPVTGRGHCMVCRRWVMPGRQPQKPGRRKSQPGCLILSTRVAREPHRACLVRAHGWPTAGNPSTPPARHSR